MTAEESSWEYSPDGKSQPAAEPGGESPAKNATKSRSGSVSWTATEYIDHQQGPFWYLGLAGITVVITAATYLISKDYIGTGFVVLLGIIVGLFAYRKPKNLAYELSDDGLQIEQKAYPFSSFKSYSLIQDGGLVSLNLTPIKRFMPPLSVYFGPKEQNQIIQILENHLPYEDRQLDAVERLTRRLHF